MQEPKYLTLKQVSEKRGVSVATLRRWIAEGKIPKAKQSQFKIGAGYAWLIPEDAEIPEPIDEGKRSPNYNHPKNERINEFA
jgi:predicted DNA-binding transcriptional regulator AlpA